MFECTEFFCPPLANTSLTVPLFRQTRESARTAAPPTSWRETTTTRWQKPRWRRPSASGPSEPRPRRRCARTTASSPPTPSSRKEAARGPSTSSSSLRRTVRTERTTRTVLRPRTVYSGSCTGSRLGNHRESESASCVKGRLGKFDSPVKTGKNSQILLYQVCKCNFPQRTLHSLQVQHCQLLEFLFLWDVSPPQKITWKIMMLLCERGKQIVSKRF